jgi:acyl-CoA synthetase (AMP-forming)/AMP-acid ligase II
VIDLLAGASEADAAIVAPGRAPLSYGALRAHVERTGRALRTAGIARADRVAIVMAGGPELATAFLAVTEAAVAAPLNPSY